MKIFEAQMNTWKLIKEIGAFTLCEVLITVGIIGIVAETVIPTLVTSTKEQSIIINTKKYYSVLTQAYTRAKSDYGSPDAWGLSPDGAGSLAGLNILAHYMKIAKNCGNGTGCLQAGYKNYKNTSFVPDFDANTNYAKAILSDGTLMVFVTPVSQACTTDYGDNFLNNVCAGVFFDVNGQKLPNIVGKDVFQFWLTKNGIIPTGSITDTNNPFDSSLAANGWGDAAWVVYNGNMDYNNCPGSLSWGGNLKCP